MKIDKNHKHELLDRLHVISSMFDEHIANHPASKLLNQIQMAKAQQVLYGLYQEAGELRFKKK